MLYRLLVLRAGNRVEHSWIFGFSHAIAKWEVVSNEISCLGAAIYSVFWKCLLRGGKEPVRQAPPWAAAARKGGHNDR